MSRKQNIAKLLHGLSRISLFGINANDYIMVHQCETPEQLLLLCGMKLFIEYNTSLFFKGETVELGTFHKLVDMYSTLPLETRFVLEQQGCRIFLKMVGHDDLVSVSKIAYALFQIEHFRLKEFQSLVKGECSLTEDRSYASIFSNRWNKLSQKRRRSYLTMAELLLRDDKEHLKECPQNRILSSTEKPFHHFVRYNHVCIDIRKLERVNNPTQQYARAWRAAPDTVRLFHMEKVFKEHLTNMFLQRIQNKYELRSRSLNR